MKKIIAAAVLVGLTFTAVSCDRNNDTVVQTTDNDTYSQVLEITNTDFTLNNKELKIARTFNKPIMQSDQVLIYRLIGQSGGNDVWQMIPRTAYVPNTNYQVDYDFEFTVNGVTVFAGGNFDRTSTATIPTQVTPFIKGQTFRVVLLPGYFPKSTSTNGTNSVANVDKSDYNAVIKAYHIDESKIIKL